MRPHKSSAKHALRCSYETPRVTLWSSKTIPKATCINDLPLTKKRDMNLIAWRVSSPISLDEETRSGRYPPSRNAILISAHALLFDSQPYYLKATVISSPAAHSGSTKRLLSHNRGLYACALSYRLRRCQMSSQRARKAIRLATIGKEPFNVGRGLEAVTPSVAKPQAPVVWRTRARRCRQGAHLFARTGCGTSMYPAVIATLPTRPQPSCPPRLGIRLRMTYRLLTMSAQNPLNQ